MSVEDELPHLLEELAGDHRIGDPPGWEPRGTEWSERGRLRLGWLPVAAVAACSAVVIGGLVAIGSLNDDEKPAAASSSVPTPPPTTSVGSTTPAPDIAAPASLDLIRIDADSRPDGTTGVVLVFDDDLPFGDAEPVEHLAIPPTDRVVYTTQYSEDTPVSVCDSTHWFPSPGNRIVDVYVPSNWFAPDALLDPPTSWHPDSAQPSKIIVCEPLDGIVQISIWGAASARIQDTRVNVAERSITIEIDAESAEPASNPVATEPPVSAPDPLDAPIVAIDGNGDAVYFAGEEPTPTLIHDGVDPDDAPSLGDGPNTVDRVAYAAAEGRFVVSFCCSPVVGQVVSARPEDLPMSASISPPKDQTGEAELVFDGYQYAPALDPSGTQQVSIVGGGSAIWVIDAAADTFVGADLPGTAGDLWDLMWNESGMVILGRTESTWTLTTASYDKGNIQLGVTRNFAPLSGFDDLRFAGAAVENEVAMHDLRTDTVLSGTIDDYGNNNGDERGSSLQVITLPGAALSAWFHDPAQLIWVDMNRTLRVGDRIIPGEYTWARR